MKTRPFDKHDWVGFAGAEGWSEDSPPLICLEETSTYLVILDKTGANVILDDDCEKILILDRPFNNQEEASRFAELIGNPETKEDFLLLGFKILEQ